MQLILYAIYHKKPGEPKKASGNGGVITLQMGEKEGDHKGIKTSSSNCLDSHSQV